MLFIFFSRISKDYVKKFLLITQVGRKKRDKRLGDFKISQVQWQLSLDERYLDTNVGIIRDRM